MLSAIAAAGRSASPVAKARRDVVDISMGDARKVRCGAIYALGALKA